jgi:hypothetical protein
LVEGLGAETETPLTQKRRPRYTLLSSRTRTAKTPENINNSTHPADRVIFVRYETKIVSRDAETKTEILLLRQQKNNHEYTIRIEVYQRPRMD